MSDFTDLGDLPPITDGLTRLMESPENNGTHFIITRCGKAGFVFGNHTIEYRYEPDEFIARLTRVAHGEGKVISGTVTVDDGKIRLPTSEDSLVSFGHLEPLFPVGHYINIIKDQGGYLVEK